MKECKTCGRKYKSIDRPEHEKGYCCLKCMIEPMDKRLNDAAKRIGSSMGEIYNPELER